MSYLRWALLFVSVIGYRVWFPASPLPSGITLDYDLVVIALVGLYRGQRVGAGAGWVVGFICYALDADHMAWGGLLAALLGWLVGHWRERLFLEQLTYRWLIFSLSIFGYKILHFVFIVGHGWSALPTLLLVRILPTALIDASAALLLGVLWERMRKGGPTVSGVGSADGTA